VTKSSKTPRYLEDLEEESDETDSDTTHSYDSIESTLFEKPKRAPKRQTCLQTHPNAFVFQCKQQAKDKSIVTYRLSAGAGYDAHIAQYPDGTLHDLACLLCKAKKARRASLGSLNTALLAVGSQPLLFTDDVTVCTRQLDGITNVYTFLTLLA